MTSVAITTLVIMRLTLCPYMGIPIYWLNIDDIMDLGHTVLENDMLGMHGWKR